MANPILMNELILDLSNKQWKVARLDDQSLIGPVQYGWDRFQKDSNSMTFGGGLLAGSPLAGTRRMIFTGYSPSWEGFYVSALGGAMYIFHRVGVNYAWIKGQSDQDVAIIIKYLNGTYDIRFEPLNPDTIWKGYTTQDGRTWEGFYALQHCLFEKYKDEYAVDGLRILTVGSGARYTNEGAIGSNQIRKGAVSHIDDWAGRGGLGSRLLQYHHVAAIVFGGDWQDPAMKEGKELDAYFMEHFGQRAVTADLALAQKYRYVPQFETGGTFGVNMHETDDSLFSFNYQSIHASDDQRLQQHDQFILGHYLKQFDEEIIEPRNFDHCGEPCAVACKKFLGEFKKDYEPYEALGPNCGIFDHRAAERVNKYVDMMGLDSIQTGGTVAWIMELAAEGLIDPLNFGLPAEKPRFHFASQTDQFDIIEDSAFNADYAIAVVKMILFDELGAPFRRGMRYAAKWLDKTYGINSINYAVYTAHGENGCMVPNQYWVPGMFSPMPIMGKYFCFYGNEFMPPYELGRKNVERFVYELYSENGGACRFHRKWVEDIIDDIVVAHYDLKLDYWKNNFDLAKGIADFQAAQSVFWESERTIEVIQGFLEKWQRTGLNHPDLANWVERFHQDKWEAGREFWDEIYRGQQEAFEQGLTEPSHIDHGFIQK